MKNYIKKIDELAAAIDFSGLISITGTEGSINLPYGLRDIPNSLPNNNKTKFAIASGTKLFTAVALCKLIEDGKLILETEVGIFLVKTFHL